MGRSAKQKRQQRAQSRLANALFQKQRREKCKQRAVQRSEKRWNKALQQLAELGATVEQYEVATDNNIKTVYKVFFEGETHQFGTRFRLQRWLRLEMQRQEEQQMSMAERHVQWMIDNNCDDHGNPWS